MFEILALALAANDGIEEIVVTSSRREAPVAEHTGNISSLIGTDIDEVGHAHIHELFNRLPGVWVMRGSGQEGLPSMRSPVLTGPGSCGAFLTLENGVPTRPSGFCNVNQLFELPTELAAPNRGCARSGQRAVRFECPAWHGQRVAAARWR